MKAVYIAIGIIVIGGIGYGIYAYMQSQKEVVPAIPVKNKVTPTGTTATKVNVGPIDQVNLTGARP